MGFVLQSLVAMLIVVPRCYIAFLDDQLVDSSSSPEEVVFRTHHPHLPKKDPRWIPNGISMLPAAHYSDQIYCVWVNNKKKSALNLGAYTKTIEISDAANEERKGRSTKRTNPRLLCTATVNLKQQEGAGGEQVVSLFSDDLGQTWSPPVQLEPHSKLSNSYATLIATKNGRVYTVYTMNVNNVTTFPDGTTVYRRDTMGEFVMKYTDNGGETWSTHRHIVPTPPTYVDFHNSWAGQVKLFWNVDHAKHRDGDDRVSFAFTKIQTYDYYPPEEVFILSSDNIMTEPNPKKIKWRQFPESYPRGTSHGLTPTGSHPRATIIEEPHVLPLRQSSRFALLCRTDLGYMGAAYTHNAFLSSWRQPSTVMRTVLGNRPVKQPRGPLTARYSEQLGCWLLLFFSNSNTDFSHRNPYWMAALTEMPDGELRASEPEIVLYFRVEESLRGPGYPDIIFSPNKDDHAVHITETNKTDTRIHKVPSTMMESFRLQLDSSDVLTQSNLVASKYGGQGEQPIAPNTILSFPAGTLLDLAGPYGHQQRRGLTMEFWMTAGGKKQPTCIWDSQASTGSFVKMCHSKKGALRISAHTTTTHSLVDMHLDHDCAKRLEDPVTAPHQVVLVLDAGPLIAMTYVDGQFCDGGEKQAVGWNVMNITKGGDIGSSTTNATISAAENNAGAPHDDATAVYAVRLYDRALYSSEIVSNFRHGASP